MFEHARRTIRVTSITEAHVGACWRLFALNFAPSLQNGCRLLLHKSQLNTAFVPLLIRPKDFNVFLSISSPGRRRGRFKLYAGPNRNCDCAFSYSGC